MRALGLAASLLACSLLAVPVSAQQATSTSTAPAVSDPQAVALLQQSLAALTGGLSVTDVTMTGTVTVNNGSTTESATITLVATAAGQSQTTLALPSGRWVTTENYAANPRTSTLTGPNGTTQDTAPEDLAGPSPAWFCPALVMAAAAPATYVASYLGQETRNGSAVQHVSIWPQVSNSLTNSFQTPGQQVLTGPGPSLPPHLGQEDLYLDSSSMLPRALVLRIRAYRAAFNTTDPTRPTIPILVDEHVEFSDYRQVQGRPVAFHIQVSFGLLPVMDIQISSITFNTGATIAAN